MALTITKLKMWKDPGYTRGCLEVPPAGSSKLPATPDYTLPADQTLRPHRDSTLTSLQLPLSFTQLFGMSYLYIEASDGNGSVKLYGWIDSITQLAVSSPTTQINWTVDWWRSYSGSAAFGMGLVTRCSDSTYKRPRTLQPRYKKKVSETPLFPTAQSTNLSQEKGQLWTIVLATVSVTDSQSVTTSRLGYFFWPSIYWVLTNPIMKTSDNSRVNTLSAELCYNGLIDEFISELMKKWSADDPDLDYNYELIAAYASPIPPAYLNWDDTDKYWYSNLNTIPSDYATITVSQGTTVTFGTFYSLDGSAKMNNQFTKTFTTFTPTDGEYYSLVDFDGNVIGNLPWGIDITGVLMEVNVGPIGGYLNTRFTSSILGSTDTVAGSLSGLMYSVPLPSYPITSNYWNEYVLSGQRDYNRLNREYAREEEAWKSGISTGESALDSLLDFDIGNALLKMMTGGADIGANLMVNEAFANKYNKLDDMAAARQKNTIQENGYSINWFYHGVQNDNTRSKTTGPWLVKMEMDTVSAAEYTSEITTMGYEVQIPVASASAFITTGGPLQIRNLVITGNIPPEAKQSIKGMLENGVRIIENNPSGATP